MSLPGLSFATDFLGAALAHVGGKLAAINKNLGACLGIWDWLFGTLHVPGRKREKLNFGVEPKVGNVHGLHEGIVAPITRAFALVNPMQALRGGPRASALKGAADGT